MTREGRVVADRRAAQQATAKCTEALTEARQRRQNRATRWQQRREGTRLEQHVVALALL